MLSSTHYLRINRFQALNSMLQSAAAEFLTTAYVLRHASSEANDRSFPCADGVVAELDRIATLKVEHVEA